VPELEVQECSPSTLRSVDGGPPRGAELEVWKLEMSMAGPLGGVLAAGPIAATTEVEDVDGGPSGGCWQQIR
jgi:hypothetical protein